MILQQPQPPAMSGTAGDTERLGSWCASLAERLKHMLVNIDDANITGLSAEKLDSGSLRLDRVSLDGASVSLDSGSVTVRSGGGVIFSAGGSGELYIGSPDGSQYIKLSGGKLSICAESVICASEVQVVK